VTRGSNWRVELSASARRRGYPSLPGAAGRIGVMLVAVTNHGLGFSVRAEATRKASGARAVTIGGHATVYDPRGVRAGDVR
jgi:hypothetical protein